MTNPTNPQPTETALAAATRMGVTIEQFLAQDPSTQAYFIWVNKTFPDCDRLPLAKIAWDAGVTHGSASLASVEGELHKAEIGNQILKEMVLSQDTELTALRAELAAAKSELAGEINMHGQTRVVVDELNTICNDLRNAGQPQFIRSEAIRLLREDQAELRASLTTTRDANNQLTDANAKLAITLDSLRADLAVKGEENRKLLEGAFVALGAACSFFEARNLGMPARDVHAKLKEVFAAIKYKSALASRASGKGEERP